MKVLEFKKFYEQYAEYDISRDEHRDGFRVYLVWTCEQPVYDKALGDDEDHIGIEVNRDKVMDTVEVDIYFKGIHIANEILHTPYTHPTNGSIH